MAAARTQARRPPRLGPRRRAPRAMGAGCSRFRRLPALLSALAEGSREAARRGAAGGPAGPSVARRGGGSGCGAALRAPEPPAPSAYYRERPARGTERRRPAARSACSRSAARCCAFPGARAGLFQSGPACCAPGGCAWQRQRRRSVCCGHADGCGCARLLFSLSNFRIDFSRFLSVLMVRVISVFQ